MVMPSSTTILSSDISGPTSILRREQHASRRKASTAARPKCRKRNLASIAANSTYNERSPITAIIFELYARNGSRVMLSTAGMESIAKTTSLKLNGNQRQHQHGDHPQAVFAHKKRVLPLAHGSECAASHSIHAGVFSLPWLGILQVARN